MGRRWQRHQHQQQQQQRQHQQRRRRQGNSAPAKGVCGKRTCAPVRPPVVPIALCEVEFEL